MIIDEFNNWFNSDKDIVGVIGMKWQDERKENFVTHSFFDQELEDEGYNLRKLALRECLYNLYDNTHKDKTIHNKKVSKKIDKIIDSVMKKIQNL